MKLGDPFPAAPGCGTRGTPHRCRSDLVGLPRLHYTISATMPIVFVPRPQHRATIGSKTTRIPLTSVNKQVRPTSSFPRENETKPMTSSVGNQKCTREYENNKHKLVFLRCSHELRQNGWPRTRNTSPITRYKVTRHHAMTCQRRATWRTRREPDQNLRTGS